MKKIVITGATSFIGVHLIAEWIKEDCEIFAVCRPNSTNLNRVPKLDNVHIVECEMNDYDKLYNWIPEADYFYHLAWAGARAPQRDDEILQQNNYDCAIKAMISAVKMNCSFFLGTGSQAEYGPMNGSVDENYPCSPNTAYGKWKLQASIDLTKKANEENVRFVWARIFSIYGKYDYSGTLVMSSIEKMKNNLSIEMTACTQLWDYLHVEDAVRAMKLLAENEMAVGVFNIASGNHKPLKEFVMEIKEVVGGDSELCFGVIPYGKNSPVNLTPNVDKLKKNLHWEVNVRFADGIKKLF